MRRPWHWPLEHDVAQRRAGAINREAGIGLSRKPLCKHGHDISTPGSYRLTSDGIRICNQCRKPDPQEDT